ncbi:MULTISPECIES: hypothetical protein [Petrotogaceae]|uniref:hypothetical protein n=1 Tax=Petrotogaceae TaxID=1643949 RepID=UPI000EF197C0|nr:MULTISPECIES: hypothetical protein [Petrotogaceae]MDN5343829.1 hypothetical protein [Oceanotoga sp.]RLL85271.1 hypothetical protein BZ25_02875 [Petrotoga sp. Shatin.DS.tank11.9.2.9.3]
MKTFILCEGRTDSHLIGFYLESAKKAKLGCYLSIYSPDWSLDKITDKIKQIDWKNLKDINSIYEKIVQGL